MTAIGAVMYREGKIRATNLTFIFWDVFYPLGYLLVFGVGMSHAVGTLPGGMDYNSFFLAGVLGMASFGIAANTSWSFFMDRDNGIFYEMLTYPLSRAQYLLGKVVFNVMIAAAQATVTVAPSRGAAGGARAARSDPRADFRRSSSAPPAGSSSTRSSRCRSGGTMRSIR